MSNSGWRLTFWLFRSPGEVERASSPAPRPPVPQEACGRKGDRWWGWGWWWCHGSPSVPGGRTQSHCAQRSASLQTTRLTPGHSARVAAAPAARARALHDPVPAPQPSIPRVACCRRHRFPTCTRALGRLRFGRRTLEDYGAGGARASRAVHQALGLTPDANSAYLIPAAPPPPPPPPRYQSSSRLPPASFALVVGNTLGSNSTCPESLGQFPFRSAAAAASRAAPSDPRAQRQGVRRLGAAGRAAGCP